MDKNPVSDAEGEESADSEANEWADTDFIARVAQDFQDAYVRPSSRTTEAKHLEAISRALSETRPARSSTFTPADARQTGYIRPAGNFARPAEPQKTTGRPASGGLASPFAARSSGATKISSAPTYVAPATGGIGDANTAGAAKWRQQHVFLGSLVSKAAVFAAAMALGASWGLARAGALPTPVQTAFSQAGDVIGLDIPAPIPVPEVRVPVPEAPPVPAVPLPGPAPAPVQLPQVPAADPEPVVIVPAPAPPLPPAPVSTDAAEDWLTRLIGQAFESGSGGAQGNTPADPNGSSVTPSPSNAFWERYGWGYSSANEGGSAGTGRGPGQPSSK